MKFILRIYYTDGTPPDLYANLDWSTVLSTLGTPGSNLDHVEIVVDPGTDPFNPEGA